MRAVGAMALVLAEAMALPAAPAPEPRASGGSEAPRRLQAGGACQGMMLEMQPIAASCCGSNMEYCQGPVPSQCDQSCQPVFESFFTRCHDLVMRDANSREFTAFQSMCHPASSDTSDDLFSDDFEGGLSQWRGKTGNQPETATIEDDGKGNNVLQVHGCIGAGDAFTADTFECSAANPCLVSYRVKGRAWQGFSADFPGNHIWAATPSDYQGAHMQVNHHNTEWQTVEYVFPVGHTTFVEGDYTAAIGQVHIMLEGFDFDCDLTMFDDFSVKRYTGSAEQAAAINAAIQPADVLFAEDFEGGSGAWHGKGSNPHPETAIVTEDRDRESMVLNMQDCTGGGDAFTTSSFECSPSNKCLVSYWVKGRLWQGFSSGFADDHVWSAVPDQTYNGGVGVHVQTVHDTSQWRHVQYVFPVEQETMIHGDSSQAISQVHLMIEGFDSHCDQSSIDDITVTRFSGSEAAAAGINSRSNANVDILFTATFEDAVPAGTPPRGWSGIGGPPNAPQTAVLGHDPEHGGVLQIAGCISGGDAFSSATMMCTPQFQCSVSYYTKGRAWQGFSGGFAGSHVWSATPDSGYNNGIGVHAQTVHDNDNWHLVEYIFPTTDTHVHGDETEPISTVHFMVEGNGADCEITMFDDIVVRRHTGETQAWCTAGRQCLTQASLPSSLVGYWALDGDGSDLSGNGLDATDHNGEWVAGMYLQSFRFDGDDELRVPANPLLELTKVTMMAWIRPTHYDVLMQGDRGIVMNKENSYEFGIEDNTGALQAAFRSNPGCWRWWGSVRVPAHEWTHTAVSYDGETEIHYISGDHVEEDPCPGGDLTPTDPSSNSFTGLKIGARGMCNDPSAGWTTGAECDTPGAGHSQFRGDVDEAMLYSDALAQAQVYSIYHRAYDANSGGEGITFIRAPSTIRSDTITQLVRAGLIGFWPLDGDGDDASGNNMGGTPTNADWVGGLFNLAFRFDGNDALVVPANRRLDIPQATMSAWVRPITYSLQNGADRGIILNKESSYEMGLEDQTGALQGAFSPCWRWFGVTRVPLHEWTHVAMAYDNTNELHYIHGVLQETDPCGEGGALTASAEPLRLGARSNSVSFADPNFAHASQFLGDVDEVMLFNRAISAAEVTALHTHTYRSGGGMTNVYAAGEPDPALLPDGCVGFWPLDGGGQDLAAGNNAQPDSEEWVKGLFGLAFRFDGDDSLRVSRCNKAMDPNGPPTAGDGAWNLDLTRTTMLAWVRPQSYAVAYEADRGIIMNKESSYEFGLADNTGALQGAFSPCWRWWGSVLIPLHEWTHVAVAYDGTNEAHFIGSEQVEATACGDGGDLTPSMADFRIGHREAQVGLIGHSNFVGDLDEAMIFNRALGENDLHGIYRGHYRHSHTAGSRNVQHSHDLRNNDVSGLSGHRDTYSSVSSKLLRHVDSLVGFWALDGDATDSSSNGLDGTAQNPEWVSGVYGLAIAFDGDDGIVVSKELIDSVTIESVTMAAWIKAEAGGNDGATFETATEGEIMVREEAYEIALRSGTGVLQAAFGTGGGESSAPWSTPCWAWYGNQIIPAHEWSHVAVSFDHTNEQQKYYVGGVQVESGSPCDPGAYGGNPLTVNEHPFQIGARMHERYTHNQMEHNDNVGHAEFMGDIDEAMLFNAAIDAEQVHYVYSLAYRSKKAGPPVPRIAGTADASRLPSSLVGYWPLDGDGTDLGRNGMTGMDPMPRWVGGKFDLAITFGNGNGFVVPDVGGAMAGITSAVTMIAYVRPTQYEACGDRGIIMNKEGSFEYGVESNTGAMQGAMSACWRWWGNVRLSLYDWTMTAVSFDGTDEIHMLNGVEVERTACAGAIESQASPLTIGARPAGNSRDASTSEPAWSQFTGDVDEAMLFSSALSSREISDVYRVSYRSGADPLPVEGEANVDTLKSHTGCRGGKALVGLWPLDGDGDDLTDADASSTFGHNLAGNDLHLTATNAQYVSGIYGQAFRFDGDDLLQVEQQDQALEADYVTMLSWVRPVRYQFIAGTARDRGIIMNKERSYEFGLEDTTGNLQGAFDPGCWRWWGSIRVPLHEWTHVAAQYDGTNEKHFVNGKMAEQTDCAGAALTKHPENYLRIGARYWSNQGDMSHQQGSSQFRGDIDEVLLFSGASPSDSLSESDVAYVYSGAYRAGGGGGH